MLDRMLTEPVHGPGIWRGADLAADRTWEYELSRQHLDELATALRRVNAAGLELAEIEASNFPLGSLAELAHEVREQLRSGRGFAVLRGFPVEGFAFSELEKMYWGLCAHMGMGITQNGQGGLIHYVTDGALRPSQGTRGVGMPKESRLHVDLTDVVSLLCVRQAPDDPPSRVASSLTIYNEILKRRPDGLARLYEGFQWDRMNEHGDGESPTSGYRVPLFSERDGVVSCRYNRGWIAPAAERLGTPLGEEEIELLDLVDQIAFETCFEFPFHPGDIQFCNNYTVMHGRAAHAEVPNPDHKRLLLRIWFDVPEFRTFSDEAVVRYGIGRHGALGWTADQVRRGIHHSQSFPRRADGALDI